MLGSSRHSMEGLPEQFVTAMRTLFSLLDTNHSGYIQLSDFAQKWREATSQSTNSNVNDRNRPINGITKSHADLLPKNFLGCLEQVAPPNNMLTFERFCAGLRLALSQQQQFQHQQSQQRPLMNGVNSTGGRFSPSTNQLHSTPTQQLTFQYPVTNGHSDNPPARRPVPPGGFSTANSRKNPRIRGGGGSNPRIRRFPSITDSSICGSIDEPHSVNPVRGVMNGSMGHLGAARTPPPTIVGFFDERDRHSTSNYPNGSGRMGQSAYSASAGNGYGSLVAGRHKSNPDLTNPKQYNQINSGETVHDRTGSIQNHASGRPARGVVAPPQPPIKSGELALRINDWKSRYLNNESSTQNGAVGNSNNYQNVTNRDSLVHASPYGSFASSAGGGPLLADDNNNNILASTKNSNSLIYSRNFNGTAQIDPRFNVTRSPIQPMVNGGANPSMINGSNSMNNRQVHSNLQLQNNNNIDYSTSSNRDPRAQTQRHVNRTQQNYNSSRPLANQIAVSINGLSNIDRPAPSSMTTSQPLIGSKVPGVSAASYQQDNYPATSSNIRTVPNMARISVDTTAVSRPESSANKPFQQNQRNINPVTMYNGGSHAKMTHQESEIQQLLDDWKAMKQTEEESLSPGEHTSSGFSSIQASPLANAIPPNPPSQSSAGSDYARVTYAGLSTKPVPPPYSQAMTNIQQASIAQHKRSYSTQSGVVGSNPALGGKLNFDGSSTRALNQATPPAIKPNGLAPASQRTSAPFVSSSQTGAITNGGQRLGTHAPSTAFTSVVKSGPGVNGAGVNGTEENHGAARKAGSLDNEETGVKYRAGNRGPKQSYAAGGRRYTVSEVTEQAANKHKALIGEERELVMRGMDFATRLRNWYAERRQALDMKQKLFSGSTLPMEYAVQEERLNYFRVQVAEINRRISAIMDSSERNFPSTLNLDFSRSAPQPSEDQVNWLKQQNQKLSAEVSGKMKLVEQLERDKADLVRQLVSRTRTIAKPAPVISNNKPLLTLM